MKIICIGRNYAEHAKELGNPLPKEPIFFLKPETALPLKRNPIFYPDFTKDLQYEVELVLRICKLGKHIEEHFAHKYYREIGIGVDLTARDVQKELKEKGLPWEKSKSFDGSAPVAEKFLPINDLDSTDKIEFRLEKNGKVVQRGNSADMIFSFDQIVAHVSQFMTLKVGDLIFTGTPEGVGPTSIDDHFEAFIGNQKLLQFNVK